MLNYQTYTQSRDKLSHVKVTGGPRVSHVIKMLFNRPNLCGSELRNSICTI